MEIEFSDKIEYEEQQRILIECENFLRAPSIFEDLSSEEIESLFKYMSSTKKYQDVCFIIESFLKEEYYKGDLYCRKESMTLLDDEDYFVQIFGEKVLSSKNKDDMDEILNIYFELYETEKTMKIII